MTGVAIKDAGNPRVTLEVIGLKPFVLIGWGPYDTWTAK